MTIDPDPLAERVSTSEEVEREEKDAKGPLDAEVHPSRRETTLREKTDSSKHLGTKAVEGDPKEKLRRIQEAKEEDR